MGGCMSSGAGAGRPNYEHVGRLGEGRTGEVNLMRERKTGDLVAVKFIPRAFGERIHKGTEREIINHRRLIHPNIIRFREVFMTDTHLAIVLDYASGGRLLDRVALSVKLSEDEARHIFQQIVEGVAYCHEQGVFHRDLRLQNVLLDGQFQKPVVKLSNFGYSKSALLDSQPRSIMEDNPAYMPPEMLLAQPGMTYEGGPVDVWHMGVILFFMVVGEFPFQDPQAKATLTRKAMQAIVNVDYNIPATIKVSKSCQDVIAKMLVAQPDKRISVPDLQKHPWVTGTAPAARRATRQQPRISNQTPEDISTIVTQARQAPAGNGQAGRQPFHEDTATAPGNRSAAPMPSAMQAVPPPGGAAGQGAPRRTTSSAGRPQR